MAQALVFGAKILVLDEPMNGLDPAAVMEMRKLILQLAGEHTILLSSHRLQEVSVMCSHLTIIKKGKIVSTGSWESMREDFSSKGRLILRLTGWKKEMEVLLMETLGVSIICVEPQQDGVRVEMAVSDNRDLRADVSRLLVKQGCGLLEIGAEAPELEDIFYKATQEQGEVRV